MTLSKINSICCIGAGYVGGPTMAVIAKNCPHIKIAEEVCHSSRVRTDGDTKGFQASLDEDFVNMHLTHSHNDLPKIEKMAMLNVALPSQY